MTDDRSQVSLPPRLNRVLAVAWYDGATEGIAFDASGAAYYFRMLDCDNSHDIRIFHLSHVAGLVESDFDQAMPGPAARAGKSRLIAADNGRAKSLLARSAAAGRAIGVGAAPHIDAAFVAWELTTLNPTDAVAVDWFQRFRLDRNRPPCG